MFKGRVMFLGGDEFLADLTSTILEKRGYEVDLADDFGDLARRIEAARPQLVVVDQVQGRGESPAAGCRRLRETFTKLRDPSADARSRGNEATILEFMDAGADECLAIPYKTTELLAKAALMIRKNCREEGRRQARRAIEKAMAGKQPDLAGGVPFGPYLLQEMLGRGSMGAVFRATPAGGGSPSP